MPRRRQSLTITDLYHRRLLAMRDATVRLLIDRWALIDFTDIAGSAPAFLSAAVAVLTAGQREAVRASEIYLAAYLTSELGQIVAPAGLDPDAYGGVTRDGRPIQQVLATAIMATLIAIRNRRPPGDALAAGLARAVRTSRTEVMDAGRRALSDAMQADDRVRGYRRVIASADPCGACMGLASGKIRKTNRALDIHPSCRCIAEPVITGSETSFRPTGQQLFEQMSPREQARLFDGRGGEQKAELIRSGAVQLQDLVARETRPEWGQIITEAPLETLIA